jgi:hypothetical protein
LERCRRSISSLSRYGWRRSRRAPPRRQYRCRKYPDAAVEIAFHYRHKKTGKELQGIKANIWLFEEGWPVKLSEYYDVGGLQAFLREIGGKIEV